jgi:hypothetical protein
MIYGSRHADPIAGLSAKAADGHGGAQRSRRGVFVLAVQAGLGTWPVSLVMVGGFDAGHGQLDRSLHLMTLDAATAPKELR